MIVIRRLRGRMVRRHRSVRLIEPGEFATSHGRYACACEAYCAGWNDCYEDRFEQGEQHALARVAQYFAAQPPSQDIATFASDLGITGKLDEVWDALHPEDTGKRPTYDQQERLEG